MCKFKAKEERGVRPEVTSQPNVTPFVRAITSQKSHTADFHLHHTSWKWGTRSPSTPGECEKMDIFNWEHSYSLKKKKKGGGVGIFVHKEKQKNKE